MKKVLFYNANYNTKTGERLGLPCWKEVIVGGASRASEQYLKPLVADDTVGQVDITHINQIASGNNRYVEYEGQHLRIRPYPRVDGFNAEVTAQSGGTYADLTDDYLMEGVIRYQYKPTALTLLTDTPAMPNEFHALVVYAAMVSICDKLGATTKSSSYQRRYDKELKRLEKRYVSRTDTNYRRGMFGMGSLGSRLDHNSLRILG